MSGCESKKDDDDGSRKRKSGEEEIKDLALVGTGPSRS